MVGVDGSEGSRQALLWAADEASLRSASLEVIHSYEPMPQIGATASAAQAEKLFEAAREAARELVDGMTVAIDGLSSKRTPSRASTPPRRSSNAHAGQTC